MPFYTKDYSQKTKQTLDSLAWGSFVQDCQSAYPDPKLLRARLESLDSELGLSHKAWVYPQILARIKDWRIVRNDSGKISVREMLKSIKSSDLDKACYWVAMSNSRCLVKQTAAEGLPYSAAVPLILAAHKKYNGIQYRDWDPQELHLAVNQDLYEAMTSNCYEFDTELLIKWRQEGLTFKTGVRAGVVKNAKATYGLYGLPYSVDVAGEEVAGPGQWPQILRMMMCQTWCWHPENRHEYMIGSPHNWDSLPKPLVGEALPVREEPAAPLTKLPWD